MARPNTFDELANDRDHTLDDLMDKKTSLEEAFCEVRPQSFRFVPPGKNEVILVVWLYFRPSKVTVENVCEACTIVARKVYRRARKSYDRIHIIIATLDDKGQTKDKYFSASIPTQDCKRFTLSTSDCREGLDGGIRCGWAIEPGCGLHSAPDFEEVGSRISACFAMFKGERGA